MKLATPRKSEITFSNFPLYRDPSVSFSFVSFRFVSSAARKLRRAETTRGAAERSSVEAVRIATNREQPPPGAFSCECMHTQTRHCVYMYLLLVAASSRRSTSVYARVRDADVFVGWCGRADPRELRRLCNRVGGNSGEASLPQRASRLFFVTLCLLPRLLWNFLVCFAVYRVCCARDAFATVSTGGCLPPLPLSFSLFNFGLTFR